MTRIVTYRDKKASDTKQSWWSEKQKYEVVAAFVLLGNMRQVSRMTGIPEITCRKWKASPWWTEAEDEIRRGAKVQLSGKLTKAIELANIALEDRLTHGDFIFDYKTGKMVRKPVTADTAVKVLDKLIDRQEMLDKNAKALETTTREGVDERLKKLAEDFLNFAKATQIEAEVIPPTTEGEVIHEFSVETVQEVVFEEGVGTEATEPDIRPDPGSIVEPAPGSPGRDPAGSPTP
jgi:hypothetical protein